MVPECRNTTSWITVEIEVSDQHTQRTRAVPMDPDTALLFLELKTSLSLVPSRGAVLKTPCP